MNRCAALRNLANGILADARMCGVYFGDRKVFLASIPGVDLADPEWRQLLDDLRRSRLLTFARANLVAGMDSALVAASEWWLDGLPTTSCRWPEIPTSGAAAIAASASRAAPTAVAG